MFFTVYRTTNLLNGFEYTGIHKTINPHDDYIGSGRSFLEAVKKFGRHNFRKKVLHIFDNADAMFLKEQQLVTVDYVRRKDTYNIITGGRGGWQPA